MDEIVMNKNLFLLDEKVYDLTEFKSLHPGGSKVLLGSRALFKFTHGGDQKVMNLMESMYSGDLIKLSLSTNNKVLYDITCEYLNYLTDSMIKI